MPFYEIVTIGFTVVFALIGVVQIVQAFRTRKDQLL
jgi:hypothetical protein